MKKRRGKDSGIWQLWLVRGAILVLAAAGIVAGVGRGEQAEVLKKAVSICLQCIGIG